MNLKMKPYCRFGIHSVNLYCKYDIKFKVQKLFSGTGSPGWSRKKGCKMVVCYSFMIPVVTVVGWEEHL